MACLYIWEYVVKAPNTVASKTSIPHRFWSLKVHLLPRVVNLHQTGLKNGIKGFRLFRLVCAFGRRYLGQARHSQVLYRHSSVVATWTSVVAFNQNRAAGYYPRMSSPTPKACGHCSSQIHLAPGADASTSVTVSLALEYDCDKDNLNVVVYVGEDRKKLHFHRLHGRRYFFVIMGELSYANSQ